MLPFSVFQQPPHALPWVGSALIWQTCVRQVAFVEGPRTPPDGVAAWHGEAAYGHLLEVICGLHSPIVGETEVLHQFKVFADALAPEHAGWRELCASLLADARRVRARHLVGLGSRSYGSAVRRSVRGCRRVAIFGTGILAQEILPYVAEVDRAVDLWGRRPRCPIDARGVTYRQLGSLDQEIHEAAAIVIAAPMTARDIARAAACYATPVLLIDLRAEGAGDPAPALAPIMTLADVFAELRDAARATAERVAVAREEIGRHARAFAMRAKCNPSGWHDLCA